MSSAEYKKHNFDWGTTKISIQTPDVIEDEVLSQIFDLIQFIKFDFNSNIHHSSAYQFNETSKDVPINLSPEFIFFLKANFTEIQNTDGLFYPISKISRKIFPSNLVNLNGNTVVKKEDFVFDAKYLILHFAVEQIEELLKKNDYKNYLISTNNFHVARGRKNWTISLDLDQHDEFIIEIQDEVGGIEFNRANSTDDYESTKFASNDKKIRFQFVIFKTDGLIRHRIISNLISNFRFESEFKEFCSYNKLSMFVIDQNGEEHMYKPYANFV